MTSTAPSLLQIPGLAQMIAEAEQIVILSEESDQQDPRALIDQLLPKMVL